MRSLILTSLFVLAACGGAHEGQANGANAARRDYAVGGFDRILLGGSHDVIVRAGAQPSVYAEGAPDDLDRLDITVKNGELRVEDKKGFGWIFGSCHGGRAIVHVTVPTLTAAMIGGSGDMTIDAVNGKAFDGSIAGSGNLQLGLLRTDAATFSIAGSGDIRAGGAVPELRISIMGSGGVDAGQVTSRTANISIAGSGDAVVQASETAEVSIAGSGDATVHGGAKCTVSTMGSGSVRCG
ncbi:MAG: head GIN domain-containing protein [Sphingomonadales bacterium]